MAKVDDHDPCLFMLKTLHETMFLNEDKVIPNRYEMGKDENDIWYLDNGASNHMTCNLSFFTERLHT